MEQRYECGLLSFDPPSRWRQRTIHVFVPAATEDRSAPSIVVSREPRIPGEVLRAHVWRQLIVASKAVHDFKVQECTECEVGGSPAMTVRATWSRDGAPRAQTLVWVEAAEDEVVTFACTSEDGAEPTDALRRVMDSARFAAAEPLAPEPTEAGPGLDLFPMPGRHAKAR